MKKYIFFITIIALLTLSFKPYNTTSSEKTNVKEIVSVNNSNLYLESIENIDDSICIIQIQITWIGDAAYGAPNADVIRNQRRTYYERFHGKSPLTIQVDNNTEIWFFRFDCFGGHENDLRATIEEDPDVCEDSDCES